VLALQKQFTLVPRNASKARGRSLPALPRPANDLGFLTLLGDALKSNAVKDVDRGLFGQYARMALTQSGFDPRKMSAEMRSGVLRGLREAQPVAVAVGKTIGEKRPVPVGI
jgi:hypothetical protein